MRRTERAFVEAERAAVKSAARAVPTDPEAFVTWFDSLAETNSQSSEALCAWLASEASAEQVSWFVEHERSHELALEDLLALTQVNMPPRSKLELARNYWESMSHGAPATPFRQRPTLAVDAAPPEPVWEALAVDNLMVALASARHYAYQSLGALGLVEHTTPQRASAVDQARQRLGLLSAAEDIAWRPANAHRHAALWSREVLAPLVRNDSSLACVIAEGALMRIRLDARRDARYLQLLEQSSTRAAQFEYAEDSAPVHPEPVAPAASTPAVRPVRWRDVSPRPTY